MKKIKHWKEIERRKAVDGSIKVTYDLGAYHVTVIDAEYMPGGYLFFIKELTAPEYLPTIYIGSESGQDTQTIEIQTISWGSLKPAAIREMLHAYEVALDVVQEIKREFPECFGKEN